MRKTRQKRKTQAKRSFWNFATKAESMAQAYKVSSDECDYLDDEDDPRDLTAIACNSIADIAALRQELDETFQDNP